VTKASDVDGSLLAALAGRYTTALSRYFERRVSRKSDVPDLVQDVFVRLARLGDLSTIERPDRYIFSTAASALKDRCRRDATHQRNAHEEFDELLHAGSEISPERVLVGKQAMARLEEALRELPVRTRDVFVLRVFEEEKLKDIAARMGISQRAVEKHYTKATAHVVAALKDFRDV
jgi:RNA polymerase sigma-70 factor (ECF subfamily)